MYRSFGLNCAIFISDDIAEIKLQWLSITPKKRYLNYFKANIVAVLLDKYIYIDKYLPFGLPVEPLVYIIIAQSLACDGLIVTLFARICAAPNLETLS